MLRKNFIFSALLTMNRLLCKKKIRDSVDDGDKPDKTEKYPLYPQYPGYSLFFEFSCRFCRVVSELNFFSEDN
jgi:hypothetical protein